MSGDTRGEKERRMPDIDWRDGLAFIPFLHLTSGSPTTRCQPITPLDSPLVLFFVAVSHGVIGEDSLMESSDI
jgi:hypothetical protein